MQEYGWNEQRIVAITRLLGTLVAAIAGGFGLAVDPESVATVALCAAAIVGLVACWWKDNNVTKAAQKMHDLFAEFRNGKDEE